MAVVASRCVFFAAPQNASNLKDSGQQLDNFEPRKLIAPSAKRPKPRQRLTLRKNIKWSSINWRILKTYDE